MDNQVEAAQLIADEINSLFCEELLAAPGVTRVSKIEKIRNVPFVDVIYSEDPSFEIHIYLFPTGPEYAIPDSKIKAKIVVCGQKYVGLELLRFLMLKVNIPTMLSWRRF